MSHKPFPALCGDCKWSIVDNRHSGSWTHDCTHPKIVSRDKYALARNWEGRPAGSSCSDERGKWAGRCGITGRLWEGKP
jgi:hypothetical protein